MNTDNPLALAPTVSIIIPAYNPGEFLREALETIHAQTYGNWELIIVDDNSSEDLSWIERDFPRARYIRQNHGGASVARNNGILNSSGAYIAFMDQDDLWRPQKLERQVAALDQVADAALSFCELEIFRGDAKVKAVSNELGAGQNSQPNYRVALDGASRSTSKRSNLLRSIGFFSTQFIVPSTVMLRRSSLATSGLLDPFIPFSGDYDLLIKLGGQHKILHIPFVDVLYRKHSNNFSDQYLVGRNEVEALVARYAAYGKSKGDKLLAKKAKKLFRRPSRMYAAQAIDCARVCLSRRDFKSFARHFVWAIRFNPIFVLRSVLTWVSFKFVPQK